MATDKRIAVVTGSASGIGRAIALRLASQGDHLAVVDLNLEGARETVQLIEKEGGSADVYEVDVVSIDSVQALKVAVEKELGTPAVIVNNAGWDLGMPFLETTPEFWRRVVDINYLGPVAMCHTFLPGMQEADVPGHVVNIGSDAGRVGSTGETVYAGAKGGVIAFTKSLAREVARYGINVKNCVCPGPTDTPLFFQQPEKQQAGLIRAIPFKRLGSPAELAAAVAYFASDEASYVTGQVLSVSGGLTMVG